MRAFLFGFIIALGLISSAQAAGELQNDKIYFFSYDGCPYCQTADEYIRKNWTGLNIEKIDIYKPGGMYLFKQCAEKFKLGRNVGTPLFCMGDKHLMGWAPTFEKRFDAYVKPFLETNSD